MEYTVPCDCGRFLVVRAGDAGTSHSCECGHELQVPQLSVLRESPHTSASMARKSSSGLAVAAVFALTLGIATLGSIQSPGMLVPIGLLTVFVGRIWFAMQILREMAPANALMVLFVPFMPTIFFFQRLDITWKPFVYGIMGIMMLFIGLSDAAN